jgi:hypothetical protein
MDPLNERSCRLSVRRRTAVGNWLLELPAGDRHRGTASHADQHPGRASQELLDEEAGSAAIAVMAASRPPGSPGIRANLIRHSRQDHASSRAISPDGPDCVRRCR